MLSIVIPAYNEERMILKTADVVSKLLFKSGIEYEIIFVNDGSKDDTWGKICEAHEKDKRVKGILFARNFGKEGALFAGLEFAKGDCCAVMDCDLQHPPETLLTMYDLWKEGYEVVEAVKASRGKESILHKLFAKLFYGMMSKSTGIDMSRASDFKLLDRKAVDAFVSLPERHLFFRALSSWLGFKSAFVEFDVRERAEGESKWSILSLVRYAVLNVTSFSTFPMQIVSLLGGWMLLFSFGFGIFSFMKYFRGNSLEGFTMVILLLMFIGSILMLSLGIIGYYIARIYEEVRRRPRYIVSKTVL